MYGFFSSVKLSIFVLIALAATSIFGTVIQQGEGRDVYVREYGAAVARIIAVLDLGDMYHSWWFQVLLTLLLLNIPVCSIRRLPHGLGLMKDREPVFEGRPVAIHERWEKRVQRGDVEKVASQIGEVLAERFKRPIRKDVDGKVYFFASKGSWSRMGVYVTHFSLFLFAMGALIGAEWGFKGFVGIAEGETVDQVRLRSNQPHDLGFAIRCDDFTLEFYPDGRISDFLSDLTVKENGREVRKQRIEVNSPLIHQGIFFYQSSYGALGAWVSLFGPRNNLVAHKRYLPRRGQIDLKGGNRLVMWDFPNIRGRPAAQLVLFEKDKEPVSTTLFPGGVRRLGSHNVRVDELRLYTGLQVAKDPGVPVIWAGCVFITVGCLAAFFASHRRIWARVQDDGNGVAVFLGGNASRNRISFERWFGGLCEVAQETFEK
jgi:cytochrome c biogenesis protein